MSELVFSACVALAGRNPRSKFVACKLSPTNIATPYCSYCIVIKQVYIYEDTDTPMHIHIHIQLALQDSRIQNAIAAVKERARHIQNASYERALMTVVQDSGAARADEDGRAGAM